MKKKLIKNNEDPELAFSMDFNNTCESYAQSAVAADVRHGHVVSSLLAGGRIALRASISHDVYVNRYC